MSFRIGFTAQIKCKNENTSIPTTLTAAAVPRKSVVQVHFPARDLTCAYYNDTFDLHKGDIVYVDGKLEGLRGRVVDVSYSFKIKLSDYKRVIGKAETDVTGELFMAGSHFISIDRDAIPFDKIITWYKAPKPDDEEVIFSTDNETYHLDDLKGLKIDSTTADRGYDYYMENRVVFIEIKKGKARAIVNGTKPYEVEFDYHNREISNLFCDCYCTGTCKHEFAALLQLRETLKVIDEEYGDECTDIFAADYLAIVSKPAFFEYVIDNKTNGSFELR